MAPANYKSIRASHSYVNHIITSTLCGRREHKATRTSHCCISFKLPVQNIDIVYMGTRPIVKGILVSFLSTVDS